MNDEDIILERLEMLERRDKIANERMAELKKFDKMPFWERIQQKGFEENIQRVEATQRWAMERTCKKDKIHKDDWKDEFALFWVGFLKGEYKSINQYLKRKNFKKSSTPNLT